MKNLLLFLTIGFLTIGCANYAYADVDRVDQVDSARDGSIVALAIRTQEEFSNAINGSLSSWYVENTLTGNILQFNRVCESAEGLVLSITGALDEADTYFSDNTWKAVFWHGDRCINTRTDFVTGAGIAGLQTRISEYFLYTDATNFRASPGATKQNAITTGAGLLAAMNLGLSNTYFVEQPSTGAILRLERVCGAIVHVTGSANDGTQDLIVGQDGSVSGITWYNGRCGNSHSLWISSDLQSQIAGYLNWTQAVNFGNAVRRAIYPHDGSTPAKAVETYAEFEAVKGNDTIYIKDTTTGDIIAFRSVCNANGGYVYDVQGANRVDTVFDFRADWVAGISNWHRGEGTKCWGGYDYSSSANGTSGLQARIQAYLNHTEATNYSHLDRDGSRPSKAVRTYAQFEAAQANNIIYAENVDTGDIIAFQKVCQGINSHVNTYDVVGAGQGEDLRSLFNFDADSVAAVYSQAQYGITHCDTHYQYHQQVFRDAGLQARIQVYIQHTNADNFGR
ncbi:hypothetical protein [Pelagibaculum spongiae]|uniref:Uncharacterized protein n=1 Tax=Pelagibaculum spongiae TaxID=2080658 RepID=A0A2V1GMS1_9GAMM|nr:hypothetical protein [Pelagibaculum spongiae]PVZ62901.1 hypothetical protein DC094_21815 [Pelagibaculum spongiae]